MQKIALSLAAVASLALFAGPSVAGERLTGEEKLAKMLEGRVAGEPRNCINTRVNSESEVIDGTAVVYGRRTRATSTIAMRCWCASSARTCAARISSLRSTRSVDSIPATYSWGISCPTPGPTEPYAATLRKRARTRTACGLIL